MKKTPTAAAAVAVAGLCWIALAGNLEPSSPPGPTMVTLREIYDKLDVLPVTGPYVVPKTGRTVCSAEDGTPVDCTGTGHDGEYQVGAAVVPRFTDLGDGTVRDNLTSLIWLKNANCFGLRNWTLALSDSNTLADGACGLTDGSLPGDWRLPNVREALSLIDYGHYIPAVPDGHPFSNLQTLGYWTSTSIPRLPSFDKGHAWHVHYGGGYSGLHLKTDERYVWPVRGGL